MNTKEIVQAEFDKISKKHGKNTINLLRQNPQEICSTCEFILDNLKTKSPCFVEIGACWGGNLAFVGSCIYSAFGQVKTVSIDLPNIDLWGGKDTNLPNTFHKNFDVKFQPVFITGDSQEKSVISIAQKATNGQIDVLFIDGDHSLKGCLADFNNYVPMVNPGGIIVLHDIKQYPPRYAHVQVDSAWAKIKQQTGWQYAEFKIQFGIGILVKGENDAIPIK